MRFARSRRWWLASALVALALAAGAPAVRAQGAAGAARAGVLVAPGDVHTALAPLAEGAAELVRLRLARLGAAPLAGRASRAALQGARSGAQARVESARRLGASGVLLVDLDMRGTQAELRLRYYGGATAALLGLGRGRGPSGDWAALCVAAAAAVLPALGVQAQPLSPEPAVSAEQLSSLGAALAALDGGEAARAWRELGPWPAGPQLEALREQIRAVATAPGAAREERPRLLAAMGEVQSAWSLLEQSALHELEWLEQEPVEGEPPRKPDAALLLAAGEVALARADLERARTFLERALELAPASPALDLALGQLYARTGDAEAARDALERARAQLPPTAQLELLERLAELPLGGPEERAQRWLRAGELAARLLRAERARALLARVRELAVEPPLRLQSLEVEAALASALGEPAAKAWTQALEIGGPDADRLLALGESLRAHGELEPAGVALEQALALAPQRSDVIGLLGELELERGQSARAGELLERAIELEPRDTRSLRALGRVRGGAGDAAAALQLYRRANALEPGGAAELQELAALERAHGEPAAELAALERAVQLDPWDPEPRAALSRAYSEQGNRDAARSQAEILLLVGGAHYQGVLEDFPGAVQPDVSPSLERMATSLLGAVPGVRRVSALALREPRSAAQRWLDRLSPRLPDQRAIQAELERALGASVELVPAREPPGQELFYAQTVSQLYAFADEAALDADAIAALNGLLDSDAVLLVRLERHGADPSALDRPCGIERHYLLDARILAGRSAAEVKGAASRGCLADGEARFARWNPLALALALAVLALLAYPFVRGWGKVVVVFKIPDHTRAMLSVSVTRRRRRQDGEEVAVDDQRWRIKEKLQLMKHRSEKRLHGSSVAFPWLAARRRPYFVTVRGPLVDQHSEELVGSFSAEKTVQVRRGQTSEIEFDMCAKEACVEVSVLASGARVAEAQVCLRGDPKSLRFVRGAPAYLYLVPGEYVLVAAVEDSVSEVELVIERELPLKVAVDVREVGGQVFRGCKPAVSLYLDGDFARAAAELERAGLRESAAKVRALAQLERGESAAAQASLVASGEHSRAAELALERGSTQQAAEHFTRAGEHQRAAEVHLRQGDPRAAALAFERAYEYERAAACYRELGDLEGLARVLERGGDLYEAGRIACALEQWDRAIRNLQQVEPRHPHYTETCLILAEILYERGERDLALERFEEAIKRASADGIELGQQARYAELLEEAGRFAEAIEVYNRIRRRDRNYPGARERVEELRRKLSAGTAQTQLVGGASGAAPRASSSGARPVQSRYEIQGELGRGAMGIVYKARDRVLDRMVALKKLPESMRDNQLAVRFFLREARSAAALNHPNIVTVYDAGQEGDEYFLTMECLEGTTLEAIVRTRRVLSARDTAVLGIQAAAGLAYAHASGIIHRDIKPSNLFYTQDRVVKIMDFGLAKAVEEVRRSATVIAGTPYYMPPEQAEGGVVDHRSDLYALGVTLFYLCTGGVPFPEGDVAYHHRHTPAPDARERVASLEPALAELIGQLLAKDPARRPPTAEEVGSRLRAIAAALSSAR